MREVKSVFMLVIFTLWMALPVEAQNSKGGITLSLKNTPLTSALRQVQQMSDYKVSFVVEDVKSYSTTVQVKNVTAPTAVKEILNGKPFTYSVNGKFTIRIKWRKRPKVSGTSLPVSLLIRKRNSSGV